jgi:hypothetical protein
MLTRLQNKSPKTTYTFAQPATHPKHGMNKTKDDIAATKKNLNKATANPIDYSVLTQTAEPVQYNPKPCE